MAFGFGKKNTAEAKIKVNYDGSKAKRGLKNLDKNVKGLGKSFKGAKTSMGLAAAAIAAITIAAIAAKKALDFTIESVVKFQAAGQRLKAIIKPTGEEFKKLEDAARLLGEATVFTATQVLESFTEMGKLGLKTNEILAAGNDVLALAALAQVDMATAATITVQALNQFQLGADEARRVVDVIAVSFTNSALDITKFSEAMKFIGPIAGQTGEEIETVTAALAVLADNALDSSLAGTAMRRILLELANANSKASKKIEATGIEVVTLTDKLKVLKDLQIDVTEATRLFGLRAATGATIVINAADSVGELAEQFKEADGAAQEMAETMLDSVEGASIRLKSAQEALALSIKDTMIPVLMAWNNWLISINRGLKGIITGEAKRLKEQTAAQKELLESQIEKQKEIFDLEDKINAARESGAKTIQIFEGRRATRLESAVRLLKQLKKEQSELLSVEEKAAKEEEKPTKKPKGLTEAEKKRIAKAAAEREKARLENGRKQVQIEEFILAEETKAKEEQFEAGKVALTKYNSWLAMTAKAQWENSKRIEFEERAALVGDRQAFFEEELKQLKDELDKKLILQEDYDKELARLNRENNALIKQEKLANAEDTVNALGTINGALMTMIDASTQNQLDALDDLELGEEEHEKRKEEILKEAQKKRRAFARVQQGIAIAEATINAIKAGTGALADTPGGAFTRILAMGAAIAAGLAEVVTIQAQNFQTGHMPERQRGRQADSIAAFIGPNEAVVPGPQSQVHREQLRAIINNTANTAAGIGRMGGGGDTLQFFGVSIEQVLQIINDKERKNSVGLRI